MGPTRIGIGAGAIHKFLEIKGAQCTGQVCRWHKIIQDCENPEADYEELPQDCHRLGDNVASSAEVSEGDAHWSSNKKSQL